MDDSTGEPGQTFEVWGRKEFARVCSGCSVRTVQRVFGGQTWVESRQPPIMGGKAIPWSLSNSVAAHWAFHCSEVSSHNSLSGIASGVARGAELNDVPAWRLYDSTDKSR
jgi:hypothetical protein